MFKLRISYLSERHSCVKIDRKVSSSCSLNHGVGLPQGSILGPFFYFILTFLRCLILKLLLFPDDTNLHLFLININSLQSRNQQEMIKVKK